MSSAEFRDFGILPDELPPPPAKIRACYSGGRIVGQYIATGLVSALGLGLATIFALTMPMPLGILACAAALTGFGALVYLATHNDYGWVELEGNALRAGHLYSSRTIERTIGDIESLVTMAYLIRKIETLVIEKLLGRVKGVEVRFRDQRNPIRILRADPAMTNAEELIKAILYRMAQIGKLDAEVVIFAGQPLVRKVHWKGESTGNPPGKRVKLLACSGIALSLLFGAILGYWGDQEQERLSITSIPSNEIATRSLIEDGPGPNRHLTLTNFRPGGFAVQSQNGAWTSVWIALFPAGAGENKLQEIRVVLSSRAIRNEADLRKMFEHGRVTGICSSAPRSNWGATLGRQLSQANGGRPLNAAWSIEEMNNPPTAALVNTLLSCSAGCFALVLAIVPVMFWATR